MLSYIRISKVNMKCDRLVVFGITRRHHIVTTTSEEIKSVDFEVKKKDRSALKISGKRKCEREEVYIRGV